MRQTNVHDISQPLHYLIRDRARDIATQATAETQAPQPRCHCMLMSTGLLSGVMPVSNATLVGHDTSTRKATMSAELPASTQE